MTEIEYEYDNHTILFGEVIVEDASFDHEFGTQPAKEYIVENFSVVVYIRGIDYDVTKGLKDEVVDSFKDDLIKYFQDNFEE